MDPAAPANAAAPGPGKPRPAQPLQAAQGEPAHSGDVPERLWDLLPRPLFSGGNEVHLLQGGDELFPAMHAAILRARHEVWIATYIFHDDDTSRALAACLRDASQRGVKVRVVVDGFGSLATLPALRAALAGSSVALAVFRPLHRWWNWFQPGQLRRLHQKLCVVDSDIAFVGGINVIGDRLDLRHGPTEQPRLDYAVSVCGPVVAPVEQAVRAVWTRAWLGRDLREELLALARGPEPMARLRVLVKRLRMPTGDGLQVEAGDLLPVRAAFVLRDNLRQRRTIERSYIAAIRGARERIDLMSPYFYPGHAFRRSLRQAAERGVKVRLILQGKVDYPIAAMAASVLYDELLVRGVRIFEYTPAFLHAKVAVVDGDWVTVGSSNIDPLSLLLNLEANLIVRDAAFAAELTRRFDAAVVDSREIDVVSGNGRGVSGFLRRVLVAWVAYVYLRVAGTTGRY